MKNLKPLYAAFQVFERPVIQSTSRINSINKLRGATILI